MNSNYAHIDHVAASAAWRKPGEDFAAAGRKILAQKERADWLAHDARYVPAHHAHRVNPEQRQTPKEAARLAA